MNVCFRMDGVSRDEAQALRSLHLGDATPYQQKLALSLIVKKMCRTRDVLFIPGDPHASAFIAGRAFVGSLVLKILRIPLADLPE